jgi:hypothetical protein
VRNPSLWLVTLKRDDAIMPPPEERTSEHANFQLQTSCPNFFRLYPLGGNRSIRFSREGIGFVWGLLPEAARLDTLTRINIKPILNWGET